MVPQASINMSDVRDIANTRTSSENKEASGKDL